MLQGVRIIEFPKITDERGNLSFFENQKHIPFDIARTYWIYDVPGGEIRGGHAYRTMQEIVIALSGSFDVVLNDGNEQKTFLLNRPYYGLYLPKLVWRHMENFSTNALAFTATDQLFSEKEYIRDPEIFKQLVNGRK